MRKKEMIRRTIRRVVIASGLAGLLTLTVAGAALAHVTAQPGEAAQGSYTAVNFRVPNERDDSGTTTLEVHFPTETPLASVSVKPVAGWESEIEMVQLDEPTEAHGEEITEAVGTITWTGGPIQPGEYQEFPVSIGPLPEDADQIVFPAIQTYESGEVVRWIEEPTEDGEEPEHPAPVLALTAAEEGGHGHSEEGEDGAAAGEDGAAGDDTEAVSTDAAGATQEDLDAATLRGTMGIVFGSIGLLLGAAALYLSTRRRGPGSMGEAG
jgi:uncharacterized protein YcnI